jgi:hypothetical protein
MGLGLWALDFGLGFLGFDFRSQIKAFQIQAKTIFELIPSPKSKDQRPKS